MTQANELITHEGVQYRKVEREAQVGDKVVALEDAGFGVAPGDVHTIVSMPHGYPRFEDKPGRYFFRSQYATLEPLPTTDAKPGDRVRIVAAKDIEHAGYEISDIFEVVAEWPDRGGVDAKDSDGRYYELYAEEFEVVRELRGYHGDTTDGYADRLVEALTQAQNGDVRSRHCVVEPDGKVTCSPPNPGATYHVGDSVKLPAYITHHDGSIDFAAALAASVDELAYAADNVEKPAHYNAGNVEVIEIIEQLTAGYDGYTAYCLGNVLKYIARAPYKHDEPTEDLRKAERYLAYALAAIDKAET